MPLNETHLGLIGLIFPQAPVIHLLRHPLDVVLSVFSNHLTHGFYCAYDLTSIARHYVLVMDLVEHYRREMALKYLAVRYEDVIDRQEESVRRMLAFVGASFDKRCLDFHENRRYARTASYAQVTEKLYDRSRYRYRAYRDELRAGDPDSGAGNSRGSAIRSSKAPARRTSPRNTRRGDQSAIEPPACPVVAWLRGRGLAVHSADVADGRLADRLPPGAHDPGIAPVEIEERLITVARRNVVGAKADEIDVDVESRDVGADGAVRPSAFEDAFDHAEALAVHPS